MSADNMADCPICKTTESFREDFEIGVEEDRVEVRYKGKCRICEASAEFNDSRPVIPKQ